ncbi:MAG: cellulase family glycosylhydrolase [Euryarchaeota archaeon]|nr:cellulase family glycosylhydrolase [Euryarchaeota archaeon]MDE2044217.1 cellulase family glycosylhydrolase [Thermoplasmata archaeon]
MVRPGPVRSSLVLALVLWLLASALPPVGHALGSSLPTVVVHDSDGASSAMLPRGASSLYAGGGLPWPFHGVDRSGTEYACIQGWGFGDGPYDLASVQALRTWNVTAVRVPLNEDCWLAINGAPAAYSGAPYRAFIEAYVALLESQAIRPILDLHWNAPGTNLSNAQQPMADQDHAPAFWASLAGAFRNDSLVIFDLYNEPHDISWNCWENGCWETTPSPGWQTAGMQELLDNVRAAGATTQLVILGGLNWSNDASGWLAHEPSDPAGPGHLGASLHMYQFNSCSTFSCWNSTLLPIVQAGVPLVTGELGESDCNATFIDRYFSWADALQVPYLGWTWDTWNTCSGPTLISSYTGTPYQPYGVEFRHHLLGFSSPSLSVPSVPQGVSATGLNRSVLLSWTPPASNGSWPVDGYNVSWGTSPTSMTQYALVGASSPWSLTVGGLVNGTSYDFAVQAISAIGAGPLSSPVVATPVANLTAHLSETPSRGTVPLVVTFHAYPYGGTPPYSVAWSFADGYRGSGSATTHTFTVAGSFAPVATVCATGPSCLNVSAPTVVVSSPPPVLVASTSAVPTEGMAPLNASFHGNATGGRAPYAFAWTFGDGGRASLQNATHRFLKNGTFVARLWVNDTAGGSNVSSTVMTVLPQLEVSASSTVTSGIPPLNVTLWANASGGTGEYAYVWSFGDGSNGTGSPVLHRYRSTGTYVVVVTVKDSLGDVRSASLTIHASAPEPCLDCQAPGPPYLAYLLLRLLIPTGIVVATFFAVFLAVRRQRRRNRGSSSMLSEVPPGEGHYLTELPPEWGREGRP